MSVLIVAGLAVIGVTVVHRLTHIAVPAGVPSSLVLNEPAGTQIAGVSSLGERLAVLLHGGGPDRVAVVSAESGQLLGTIRLAR